MNPSALASPSDPLGYDVLVTDDLDPSGRDASGLELVLYGMLHRLSEDTLLMTGAPNDEIEFGKNVRKWVGEALSQDAINAKAPLVEMVLRRDVCIASVTVKLTLLQGEDSSRRGFLIDVRGQTTKAQPIDRVIGVSALTVEFLAEGK